MWRVGHVTSWLAAGIEAYFVSTLDAIGITGPKPSDTVQRGNYAQWNQVYRFVLYYLFEIRAEMISCARNITMDWIC